MENQTDPKFRDQPVRQVDRATDDRREVADPGLQDPGVFQNETAGPDGYPQGEDPPVYSADDLGEDFSRRFSRDGRRHPGAKSARVTVLLDGKPLHEAMRSKIGDRDASNAKRHLEETTTWHLTAARGKDGRI